MSPSRLGTAHTVRATPSLQPPLRLAVFLVMGLAVAAAFPAGTTAETIADKRAEAARIREQVDAQAERIAAADRALRLARSDQLDADAEVLTAEAQLRTAQEALAAARVRLAARAVEAYVHGGQVSVVEHIAGSDGTDLNLRRHYMDTAVRVDREAIDALQRTEDRLVASQRGLREARQAALQSIGRVQANRGAVAASEAAQRANLRRVQGELGELVRQQQRRVFSAALRRAERATAQSPTTPQAPLVFPAPGPTTTNPPLPAPPPSPPGGIWACIREKESGNNYRAPNGGAYQFQLETWRSLGGVGLPEDAPPAVQDAMAIMLQQRSGWDQWSTAKACGAY